MYRITAYQKQHLGKPFNLNGSAKKIRDAHNHKYHKAFKPFKKLNYNLSTNYAN